jgi:hypothetical protein
VIVAQYTAEAFATLHTSVVVRRRVARTLEVIMLDELRHEQPKMTFAERHDVMQALGLFGLTP